MTKSPSDCHLVVSCGEVTTDSEVASKDPTCMDMDVALSNSLEFFNFLVD